MPSRIGRSVSLLLFASFLLISAGVGRAEVQPCPDCSKHALYFGADGLPVARTKAVSDACVDPTVHGGVGWSVITQKCFDLAVDEIVAGIRQAKQKKVLIFFHGGLNSLADAETRTRRLISQGAASGAIGEDYYAIFINWQASLLSSYKDHLIKVRQGRRRVLIASSVSPYTLSADIVDGALSMLPDTVELVWNSVDRGATTLSEESRKAELLTQDKSAEAGLTNTEFVNGIEIRKGTNIRSGAQKFYSAALGVPWLPLKPVTTGVVIDGMGEEAWKVMVRRTQLVFGAERCTSWLGASSAAAEHVNRQACRDSEEGLTAADPQARRSLTAALNSIRDALRDLDASNRKSLTLVAHSAGSFILNQALQAVPDLHADNIVYMAAAAPIKDYEQIVLGNGQSNGYLAQPANSATHVYHLTLHPDAELGETYFKWADVTPRGSLLQWIDAFLFEPRTVQERTMGRASTLAVRLQQTPQSVASRIHVKVFDYGQKQPKCSYDRVCQPQRHGDFSATRFWDPVFWDPKSLPPAKKTR